MTPKVSLPSMEHDFDISVMGDRSGTLYEGKFKYKRPNLGQMRQARTLRAHLNEDLKNLDDDTLLLNEMMSWLSVSIMEAPTWWQNNGWDLMDMNVVEEIYAEVLKYENSFNQKIQDMGKDEDEPKESKTKRRGKK